MSSVAKRFSRLFRGRETCRGVYHHSPTKRVKTVREAAKPRHWKAHLEGEGPYLGIVPITLDNTCYFGAIDLDDDGADHQALDQQVRSQKLPLLVCRSKSGGAHLYLFLTEPVPASLVVSKLTSWIEALGLQNPLDEHGRRSSVEVFPKQQKIRPDDLGNWINLPYYGGDKTDRYAVYQGKKLSLGQFLDTADQLSLSHAGLESREPELSPDSPIFFKDGPPCLQTLHTSGGFTAGNRNLGLYNVGIYLKLKFPDDWEERAREYNEERLDPPLPDTEVDDVVRSLSRKEYVYRCSDAPIEAVCQKSACKKQLYGIDKFRKSRIEQQLPEMGPLEVHLTVPPYYVLRVEGTPVKMSGADLLSLNQATVAIFDQTRRVLPYMKAGEWRQLVSDLSGEIVEVEAPKDAGFLGQLMVRLREFLALRHRSDSQEGLLQGKPWGQNGKVYFRSSDLIEFLERKRVRGYTDPQEVWAALHRLGAGASQFKIKGARVDVWFIKTPDDEQSEELTLPEGTEELF